MSEIMMEYIRKYPELVLQTIDHGVVICCASCRAELPSDSPAIHGRVIERGICEPWDLTGNPRCPHCGYNIPARANKGEWQDGRARRVRLWGIPSLKFRKYEHVLEYKKTWFSGKKIIRSVVEMVPINTADTVPVE